MTSYQPTAAPRISPAKLAIAGALAIVLSVALIFVVGAVFGALIPSVVVVTSIAGRALFVAGIVLMVLAAVRKLDRR